MIIDEEQKQALNELKELNQQQIDWNDIKKPKLSQKPIKKVDSAKKTKNLHPDPTLAMDINLNHHISSLMNAIEFPNYYLDEVKDLKEFQIYLKPYLLKLGKRKNYNLEELKQKIQRQIGINNRFQYKAKFQINRQPLLKTMDFDIRALNQVNSNNQEFLKIYDDLEDDEGVHGKEFKEKHKELSQSQMDISEETIKRQLEKKRKELNLTNDKKIFIIQGSFKPLREYFLEQGWIENPDINSPVFDYKHVSQKFIINQNALLSEQITNRYFYTKLLTTKYGLCKSIKNCYQFTGVDALTFFPRCYDLNDEIDFEDFLEEYKYSFAESMLIQLNKDDKLDDKTIIKLNLCVEVMKRRCKPIKEKLEDLLNNGSKPYITRNEWLLIFRGIMSKQFEKFLIDPNKLKEECASVLNKWKQINPQASISKGKNVWVVKPCGSSRGREQILPYMSCSPKTEWVIQKCVENLMIIDNKKFDIRQWILVSELSPLKIFMYDECYIRFCGSDYSLENLSDRFAHLTNFSVQKYNVDEEQKSVGKMWSQDEFINYLKEKNNGENKFRDIIQPKMKEIVINVMKSAIKSMEGRKNSFEIFGLDFLIDDNLNPWLIEINASPTFEITTNVTEKIVNKGLRDLGQFLERYMFGKQKGDKFGDWKCIYK